MEKEGGEKNVDGGDRKCQMKERVREVEREDYEKAVRKD